MAIRRKKGRVTFKPVDFSQYLGSGELNVIIPPEVPKKTFTEVMNTINRELDLVAIGLSKNCAMAIQFHKEKTPFCRVLSYMKEPITAQQVQELIRLAAQDFGNRFSEFVKEELRNLF